jgi:Serine dehydrogenase proteinase
MATFGDVLIEIQDAQLKRQREGVADAMRRKYIAALHQLTGRNVVVYYSAFLHRQGPEHFLSVQINDEDKHGFMAVFAGLDFDRGLDLILHSPGGDIAATESVIDYLRSKFSTDIRTIVPQISMSGGSGREIVMGSHSNLGPIDPQMGGRPAIAILAEFERARNDIAANPNNALLWQPILQKYMPAMLSQAQHAIEWSREIGQKTLIEGMFKDDPEAKNKANTVVNFLLSHDLHRAHGRHLHRNELRAQSLNIVDLEAEPALQDAVMSVHHACMLTVGNYNVNKLVENHNGIAHMKVVGTVAVQMPGVPFQVPTPNAPPLPPAPLPGGTDATPDVSGQAAEG